MKSKKNYVFLLFFLGICLINYFGGVVTRSSLEPWYQTLVRPSFSPPNWIFAPVWGFLYVVIAWVGAFLWNEPKSKIRDRALTLWFLQMSLNFMWSYLFFGFKNILFGALEITLLVAAVGATLIYLKKINKTAYIGFVLYFLWICYAAILNWSIYFLNKG
jgi:tryptophan-rich sensory protein